MDQLFYFKSELFVLLSTLGILLISTVVGFGFGCIRPAVPDSGSNMLQSSMLTLLSLLLAFGVSMSEMRYEARKTIEVAEANAISTTYLRSRFLPDQDSKKFRNLLNEYVNLQIGFYREYDLSHAEEIEKRTAALQNTLWNIPASEIDRHPRIQLSLLLTSLNEVFDLREKQYFLFKSRVPLSIICLLYLASIMVMCLVGYLFTQKKTRHIIALLILSFLIAATLFVILDLDRPRKGFIRVGPGELIRLQTSLQTDLKS